MERSLFKIIRNQAEYPNISILLPTRKSFMDGRQVAGTIKQLAREARQRLLSEFDRKKIRPLLSKLERAVSSVDLTLNLDGLAIFVNSRFEMVVRLPFPVKERLIIDTIFSTRDLIRAINRGINYYILFVSESFVRLFEANRDNLSEINEGGFPFVNPIVRNTNNESAKEIRKREFYGVVNKSFALIYKQHPMKLIIAGAEVDIFLFSQIEGGNVLLAPSEKLNDNTRPHELAKLVWPLVQSSMKEKRMQVLENLNEAVGQKRLVTGIDDVWNSACQARGELLVVDEDYPHKITISTGQGIQVAIDDVIDEISEKVVSAGGKVVFTENGTLQGYNHIALVLKSV